MVSGDFGQTDSLLNLYNNSEDNQQKFQAALLLSDQMLYIDIDEAKFYLGEAQSLQKKLNDSKYQAEINLYQFEILSVENKENECVELMLETIDFCNKNQLLDKLGHAYNKLGAVYIRIQLLDKAQEYFMLANETFQSIHDFESQKNTLNNLGAIYYYKNDFENAIKYFQLSYEIEKQINNNEGMAQALGNLGAMYCKLDPPDFVSAELSLSKSLEISKLTGNPEIISSSLNNLTYYYIQIEDVKNARDFNEQALLIAKSNKLDQSVVVCLENKIEILKLEGDYESALEASLEILDYTYELYSSENTKALAELESIYQNKEKKKENELLKKQSEIDKVKIDYEQQKSLYLFIGLGIVAALGFFAFNRFLVSQKRKKVIEEQKAQVEEQKELLHQQNEIVKEKNAEISDSITYAKRIQSAILPPRDALNYHLKDGFLIFKPKDIVSGDFYWLFAKNDQVFFAVADCTGHGVPGAMVSVVCSNALSRSIREFNLTDPALILDKTRELVIENFSLNNQIDSTDATIKDGMDISICVLNQRTKELMWAGANNPIWIIRDSEIAAESAKYEHWDELVLTEISGDKQPVGVHEIFEPFTCHTLQLKVGDQIVIFSDGYADQFGGENGKKLKYRPFKQLLLKNAKAAMNEQKDLLENFFEDWKGEFDQIDDVCIIGVRI